MRARGRFDLPDELEPVMERARRLEWITLAAMTLVGIGMYLTMGSSQAMKAAWVEDLLSLVAPLAFLIAARYRAREPSERFPYGHHRAVTIAFLSGAVALTLLGLYILGDSLAKLLRGEHPSLGAMVIFGQVVWSGWPMVAMLLASVAPPLILGRAKSKLAPRLHDKTLKADADMNKADWQTALAGVAGIVGIGHGLWWADGAAGVLISASIVKDGVQNLRSVVANLMDSRPLTVEGSPSQVPEEVRAALLGLPWVRDADVRMREEGHTFCGELFLQVSDVQDLAAKLVEARRTASAVDWRVHDMVIELEGELPERPANGEAAGGRAGDPRPLPGS